MRALGLLIACLLIPGILCPESVAAQTWTDVQVSGVTRRALVYVPDGIDEPPLLISLHGRGIPAGWNQAEMMKFEPIADREKFIVVYPEAQMNLNWDLGGSTDIDFVRQIIEDLSAQYGVDRNRVYASGFSMGGMFSYTLACKIPDLIAAIAPGNGYPLGGFGRAGCVDTRPVPIFHMHGTADDFVKYSGIHAYLQSWIGAYGCPATAAETRPYPESNPSSQSFKESWGPCTNSRGQQSEVVLVSVTGMIHDWASPGKANANEDPAFNGRPFDINGSEEAWAFLKNHSLEDDSTGDDMAGSGGGTGGGGTSIGSGDAGMGAAGVDSGMAAVGSGGMGGGGEPIPGTGDSPPTMGQAGQSAPPAPDRGSTSVDGGCQVGLSSRAPWRPPPLLLCLGLVLWRRGGGGFHDLGARSK